MQQNFFSNLKVIELASVLAGPAVGLFFAELGAKVIKVENKTTQGDVTRSWKLPTENPDAPLSSYYCCVNWHKESLLLDLRDKADYTQLLGLIEDADVVISNYKPTSAKRMGVDYKTLKNINKGLIYGQLTAFGDESKRSAFDIVLQAEAGFLYMTGEKGGSPVRIPVALIDLIAAHQLKEGVLLGLLHRERTGDGSYITVSLLEAALASLANQATNWLMGNHQAERMGTQHPNIAPYGDMFSTKNDKQIVLAIGSENQFVKLCKVLKVEELAQDNRFSTNAARVKNRILLLEKLKPAILQFEHQELLKAFEQFDIPAGSIRSMSEVFELPETQNMILEEEMDNGDTSRRLKTVVFKMNSDG